MTEKGGGVYLKLIVVESCEYRGSSWALVGARGSSWQLDWTAPPAPTRSRKMIGIFRVLIVAESCELRCCSTGELDFFLNRIIAIKS